MMTLEKYFKITMQESTSPHVEQWTKIDHFTWNVDEKYRNKTIESLRYVDILLSKIPDTYSFPTKIYAGGEGDITLVWNWDYKRTIVVVEQDFMHLAHTNNSYMYVDDIPIDDHGVKFIEQYLPLN